jgi:hypothetical protein
MNDFGLTASTTAMTDTLKRSDLSRVYSRLDQVAISSRDQFERLLEHGRLLDSLPERLVHFLSSNQVLSVANADEPSPPEEQPANMQQGHHEEDPSQRLIISRHLEDGSYAPLATQGNNSIKVRIRASAFRRHSCEGFCSCDCHKLYRFNTPQSAYSLLGTLFVGYSGWPSWRRPCNEPLCQRQSIPSIALTYFFPPWLVARMLHVAFSLTYMNGPKVSLAMPRTIAGNSEIFTFAIRGDLGGIKSLFSQGLASPFDVCESNGRTALHVSHRLLKSTEGTLIVGTKYAAGYNHREISKFLIDTGADTKLEDKEQA